MSITHGGLIYEDREAPRHVLQAEVERLRPLANPDVLSLVASNVRAERARIRKELLAEITKAGAIYAQDNFPAAAVEYLEAALDRILPEEG